MRGLTSPPLAVKLLQPLNNSYIPNRSNIWPELADPWYDKGSQYSVVNTVTTIGVAWRTDMTTIDPADFENPWNMLWDPSAKGKVGFYDQFREAMAFAFYRNGGMDPNTSSQDEIDKTKDALLSLVTENDARITVDCAYLGIPEGKFAISHSFSGDMGAAQHFLPKGQSPSTLRYVSPRAFTNGRVGGHIGTDNYVVARASQSPVLAHLFINHAVSTEQASEFYGWVGGRPGPAEVDDEELTCSQGTPAREPHFDDPSAGGPRGRGMAPDPRTRAREEIPGLLDGGPTWSVRAVALMVVMLGAGGAIVHHFWVFGDRARAASSAGFAGGAPSA